MADHFYSAAFRAGLMAGAAVALGAAPALAQSAAGPGPAPTAQNDSSVAEVIVTAQKREQRLQDVPIVVTVLNQQKLQDAQVRSVSDLAALTPGLTVNTNASESTTIARIRGVGNVADNPGLEQSVGLYIDGVYRPRNGVGFQDLGELSDIEILKGPQGTLFGKNTIAGVIQITTVQPSFTPSAEGEATVQNYGGYGGSITVNGPIIPGVLAGRLYGAVRQREGFVPVVQAGTTNIPSQNDEHVYTLRGQLLFTPINNFDLRVIADYSKRDDHCCIALDYQNGFPATLINEIFPGSIPNPVSPQNRNAYINYSNLEHIIDEGVSATAHWTTPWFNNARLTSITAWRDNKDRAGGDTDSTLADLLVTPINANFTDFKQFSEELQYAGTSRRLDWQVGAYFSHEVLDSGTETAYGSAFGPYLQAVAGLPATGYVPGEGAIDRYHQVEHSEAIYTQENFHLTDKLSLIGGLRYTWEHKDLTSNFTNTDTSNFCANTLQFVTGSPTPIPYSQYVNFSKASLGIPCLINPAFKALGSTYQSLDEGALTGTAKIQYTFDHDHMAYASYSRGNLVGGFNLAEVTLPYGVGGAPNTSLGPQVDTSFPAEFVDAYEIGTKTAWLDRRLTVNVALFYQRYYNHQLNAFTGTQFVEFTIPHATARGVELESAANLGGGFTVNGGVTYANTYYPDNPSNRASLQAPGSNLYLLPGQPLSYAPLWSVVFGGNYEHGILDNFVATASMDVKYTSKYNDGSDLDPNKLQPGYWLVDASIGIATADKRISLQFWATNLFNQFYKQAAFDGVVQTLSAPPAASPGLNNYYYFPAQPRFYGMTLRFKY